MNGTFDEKNDLRKRCSGIRAGLDPLTRAAAEEKIRSYISSMASYRHARLLLFYAPIGSEVDIFPLFSDALKKKRAVAFPRCEAKPGVMTFRLVTSVEELKKGAFGVREPGPESPVLGPSDLASNDIFALIPGLAFDRSGLRLGYGKGYYDRFLSSFGGFSVGVCFGELLLDRLPKGYYDRRVNAVVCERGVKLVHA